VDPEVLGIQLMRCVRIIALAWVLLLRVPASAQEYTLCTGRPLVSRDGSAATLTDCDLEATWERVGLRARLEGCVRDGRASGVISFGFSLYPGGGIGDLESKPENPCVEEVLKTCLAGPLEGTPGFIEGHLVATGDKPEGLTLSLAGWLYPRRSPVKPLPGRLVAGGDGFTATCPLGAAYLALRLDSLTGSPGPTAAGDRETEDLVDSCERNIREGDWEAWTRADWKREREQSCKCLTGLLSHADLEVRGLAAERLARGRYWKGRRALTAVVKEMMKPPGCPNDAECLPVAPKDAEAGLVLVRMVRAHLRLRRWVKDEYLEALARHPSRKVRLHLVRDILKNWRMSLPPAIGILYRDSDPVVRARACDIGCQREDRTGREEFLKGLMHPQAEIRAATILYAGSCVEKASLQVRKRVREEADLTVALLMLQALPTAPEPLVVRRAIKALFDPCPIVRFLAGRLLQNAEMLPKEEVKQALAREPNVVLKEQLVDLLGRGGLPPSARHRLQIWLQFETGENSPGPKSSR
jgi:hypothetical protein